MAALAYMFVDRLAGGRVYAAAAAACGGGVGPGVARKAKQKQECSFLKKRTKKLLLSGHGLPASGPWPETKSLLLLFFRKEDSFVPFHHAAPIAR
jgi:hypothetical protein